MKAVWSFASLLFVTVFAATSLPAAPVTLVDNGQARVCVVVDQAALDLKPESATADGNLRNLRWAADDLVAYLGRMSGATVVAAAQPVPGLLPIYVGTAGETIPMTATSEFGDAYLIDVSDRRIILQGESPRAVYYAAAMLLHALGVRWYAPTEIGEVVPSRKTLTLEAGITQSAPQFQERALWAHTPDNLRWALRNRMGGPSMAQGHGFYHLIEGAKYFKDHPEYFPVINGKPAQTQVNLSNPAVADIFTKNIAEQFRKGPTSWAGGNGACIGPDDGALIDERPDTRALQNGEIDPLLQLPSMTDPFINLCNKVAAQLEQEFPNHYLGFYVYSNHNLPPTLNTPNKMLFPIITPITYTRYGSIGNPRVPTSSLLEHVIKTWRPMVPRMGSYLYNFNLADTAMPFSRRLYWSLSYPKLYDWGVHYATIESMQDNWQHCLPGNYIAGRILWDTRVDVNRELDEFFPAFYGPAGSAMRRYNAIVETAYENTDAFASNLWAMHRILTPAVMAELGSALGEATRRARGKAPYAQRVEIATYGYNAARHFLAARAALNAGKFAAAAAANEAFKANWTAGSKKYPLFVGRMAWRYYEIYHYAPLADAGRIAREGRIVYRFPDEWTAITDKDRVGLKDNWYLPQHNTGAWGRLKTCSAGIDDQGFRYFRGIIWYRHEFATPAGAKKVGTATHLWFGGNDDTSYVYLNGKNLGRFSPGNFGKVDIDVTGALAPQGNNVLVVGVDNGGITELGTGGIMRPVVLYTTTAKPAGKDGEQEKNGGAGPLFGG